MSPKVGGMPPQLLILGADHRASRDYLVTNLIYRRHGVLCSEVHPLLLKHHKDLRESPERGMSPVRLMDLPEEFRVITVFI
jgi:hypothetical protein